MGRASRRKKNRVRSDDGAYEIVRADDPVSFSPKCRPLPPKKPNRHRLMVMTSYTVSWEAAEAADRGEQVHMDMENIVSFALGCWDCEKAWSEIKNNPVCLAPEWKEELWDE